MTTLPDLEDDVRAALRQRAETHDVVVPDLDALLREPVAVGGPATPRRRRVLVAAAAALLVVALGAAAVALTADGEPESHPRPLAEAPPTPGTHGAILVGFGPPVDASEWLWAPGPTTSRADPVEDASLVVLDEVDGDGTAVISSVDAGDDTSFDTPAYEGPTPIEVGGLPAVRYAPNPLHPGLTTIEVDRGGGGRLFVAGRALAETDLVALGAAALGASDPLAPWWPEDRYRATYAGPDRNPFSRGAGDERRMAYEGERPTMVTWQAGSADPLDYAWFYDGATVEQVDDRTVVRWAGSAEIGPLAAWAEAGGMVSVGTAEAGDLDAVVAATHLVDRATWEAERARATAPGSRFQTATTSMPADETTTTTG